MNTHKQDIIKRKGSRFKTVIRAGLMALATISVHSVGHSALGADSPPPRSENARPVLADIEMLEKIGAPLLATHPETGVAFARITPQQEKALSLLAHERGRCGGFEALPETVQTQSLDLAHIFTSLSEREAINRRFKASTRFFSSMSFKSEIDGALTQVSESELRSTVESLSGFKTRFHQDSQRNDAVLSLQKRVEGILKTSPLPAQIELLSHSSTKQNSLRVRIPGAQRPSEIIVLGAHLDSINNSWFGGKEAPGADDNASGSANLVEVLRILANQPRLERTIEFIWYAGEEGGLLGSSEIARRYKEQKSDVIAVLQLDMTLHPGDGEFTLGSMTDFTSAWFRGYLEELNSLYIKAKIIEDQCGYGCSDHASWYRQGYATLMPFEATYRGMNPDIHTNRDLIKNTSSFKHSAIFSKIALAISMDLGNSPLRETK